jgi:predicted nucleic acid-binding protein
VAAAYARGPLVALIDPPPPPRPSCRDPDDERKLALALAAKVEPIVSGHHSLLLLDLFRDTLIIGAAGGIALIAT